jgi:hypothetical protein
VICEKSGFEVEDEKTICENVSLIPNFEKKYRLVPRA